MNRSNEAYVASRFDTLEARFRADVGGDDYRLGAIRRAVPTWRGLDVLDLGCGKGRFARHFGAWGARVVGVDTSRAMLAAARGLPRARASARRLPLAASGFDVVVAVEVFQHLDRLAPVLDEVRRVLRPGGWILIVDRNPRALDAVRPWLPSLALKCLDEHRGRWMYPAGSAFRERWLWPRGFARQLSAGHGFTGVRWEYPLSPEESRWRVFRGVQSVRRMVLWRGRKEGQGHG
jgi:2-polyprenyl-6-hydroxyphenyl methylase/3-demethylubiquinone-9 3-methyltransferase